MSRILDTINSPVDVKKLGIDQLTTLAQEIREELITVVSKNGGHLGPNLGVVELTIAMHYVFDTPTDNFIFDVAHQAYVHKLLTGRRDRFHTIRTADGLNGFMLRSESKHDCFGAGHAGTAVSAGLGMATARDLNGTDENVVVLAGDAAFTCGVTYEGLNNIRAHTKKMIVILNDNEWSIDKNVGAIADYFNRVATSERYAHLHEKAASFLEKIGGKKLVNLAKKAEESVKNMVFPSVIFEELGLEYYGPINGHDISNLIKTLEFLKKQEKPVLLHVLTTKAKGYEPAMAKQKAFHGTAAFDPETGEASKKSNQLTYSQVFADTLSKIADNDDKIVAITGAMPNGTALDRFQPKHPDRYFDVGIAEEHAVLFAAGMATKGLKPVCAIYSTFLQRAYDQIIHDVCLQKLNVTFCMDRGSLSPDDGATHHGLFDIAYLHPVPNMIHMVPKDEDELADMLLTATEYNGPIAIRYPRGNGPGAKIKQYPQTLQIGKAEVIKDGQQISIWALGNMLEMAADVAKELEARGYSVSIINPRFTKPIDREMLETYARKSEFIITMEDHVIKGGFGSIVLEELNDLGIQIPVIRLGWPDEFVEHGSLEKLRQKFGVTKEAVLEKCEPLLAQIEKYNAKATRNGTAATPVVTNRA